MDKLYYYRCTDLRFAEKGYIYHDYSNGIIGYPEKKNRRGFIGRFAPLELENYMVENKPKIIRKTQKRTF